jgi:hypothetical protein
LKSPLFEATIPDEFSIHNSSMKPAGRSESQPYSRRGGAMLNHRYRWIGRALAAWIAVALLYGQTAGTGALTGTVSDPTGSVVPNVTVTVTNTGSGQARTAVSAADGSYTVGLLPPGNYRVQFSALGFKSAGVGPVTITVTETPVLNRVLEVGSQTEQVTVEANAEVVQASNATLGTVVSTKR